MLGNDVLDRFDGRRRFWRRIINAVSIVFNICMLWGLVATVILMMSGRPLNFETHTAQLSTSSLPPSEPRPQKVIRSAETKPEIAPTVVNPATSSAPQSNVPTPAPVEQPTTIVPAIPDQAETRDKLFPETKKSNQASFSHVPMPVARPDQHVLGQTQKSTKTDESNNRNKNGIVKPGDRLTRSEEARHQSDTEVVPTKSEDTRKTVATNLEQNYSNAGISISTHVSGLNGTVLNMEYPKFDDALVQKIMSLHSFTEILNKTGFTMIIFRAGQDKTWAFPLQPPSQPDTALQGPASDNARP